MNRLINEKRFKKLISIILEQTEDDTVTIDVNQLNQLLDVVNYDLDVLSKTKMFRGKKIIVNGSLKLNDKRAKSMGNIIKVIGSLDISNSEIGSLKNVEVTGNIWDSKSKRERLRLAKIRADKLGEGNERRETGEWDATNENMDEDGILANALLSYFEDEGYRIRTPEDNQRLEELREDLENLRVDEEQMLERGEDITDLTADIEAIEEEIEEIEESFDVYHIIPEGTHFGLTTFNVYGTPISENNTYAVGTYDDAYEAAVEYIEGQIKDDITNVSSWVIRDSIDEDEVVDYFEDIFSNDIEDSPESYFDESDYELSPEDEERKEQIEEQISELEEKQYEFDRDSPEYDEIQEMIDELQEEIDDMEPVITDEMKEEKLEEKLRDVRYNLERYMDEFSLDMDRFVDYRKAAETVVDSDGVGHVLAFYDGNENEGTFRGETFSIFRVD